MGAQKQQRRVAATLLMALALGGLLLGSTGCAPRRTISSVVVDGRLDGYGTLEASEARTLVAAHGEAVDWEYSYRVGAVVEVLSVSGESGDYALVEDSAAHAPGTYTITSDEDHLEILAFPEASEVSQTLTLHYRVQGVGLRWFDTGEFSWPFIADGERLPVDSVRIHVVLPGEIPQAQVRAWANGPLYSDTTVNADGSIDVVAPDLPPKTGVEVRALFPSEFLPERMVSPWKRTADVLEYENDIALQVAVGRFMDRARRAIGWALGVLGPALALAYTMAYRWTHRAEFRPPFQGEYYRELPADIMPALVSALMSEEIPEGRVLAATVAGLIDRGVLSLACPTQDVESCRLSRVSDPPEHVTRSESSFVTALFDRVVKAETFTLDDFRARASTQEGAQAWDEMIDEFQQKVSDELVVRRYLEHRVTTAGTGFMWLAGVLLGAGLIARVMADSLVPVAIALVASPIVALFARKMRFVTQQSDDLAGKYAGVRNYLRDIGTLEEPLPGTVDHWRPLLTLAVLFGLAEGVVRTLGARLPDVAGRIEVERWLWASELSAAATAGNAKAS